MDNEVGGNHNFSEREFKEANFSVKKKNNHLMFKEINYNMMSPSLLFLLFSSTKAFSSYY